MTTTEGIVGQLRAAAEWVEHQDTPAPEWEDLLRQAADIIGYERALADDLADVLSHMVVGWEPIIGHDLALHPSVVRVMARYRTARK